MHIVQAKTCSNMLKKILAALVIVAATIGGNSSALLAQGAQRGGNVNYLDSAYIPKRLMDQHRKFLQHEYNYPAKPRNAWALSVYFGYPYVDGDAAAVFKGTGSKPNYAIGAGVSIRKALGYLVSLRSYINYYNFLGLDYQRNLNINNHPRILSLYATAPRGYLHSYKTTGIASGVDIMFSLNNILFHKEYSRLGIAFYLGGTGLLYRTQLDIVDGNGERYYVENINTTGGRKRSEVRKDIRSMYDGKYETEAVRKPTLLTDILPNFVLRPAFNYGICLSYKTNLLGALFGDKAGHNSGGSINFEFRRMQLRDDYVDGYFRQSGDLRYPTLTPELDNASFISLGYSWILPHKGRRVPPLWWLNPLQFSYGEMTNPKYIKLPKMTLADADGDGVTDQFDLEPNTPEGCPVDTHGVTRDLDGDGVPDCKDKEILTQQKCFPVDEDGVGTCPEPACCEEIRKTPVTVTGGGGGTTTTTDKKCTIGDLPSVVFKKGTVTITRETEAILSTIAEQLKAHPDCNIRIIGYGASDKRGQQNSWDQVYSVIRYLVDKQGVAENRLIFVYGSASGDYNTVDLEGTSEKGSSIVPAPHPNLKTPRN
jgi:OmpA-OmpF porin, OOP family